jgi:leader peptidase (prepilin peptidase)/N-methyltransferase
MPLAPLAAALAGLLLGLASARFARRWPPGRGRGGPRWRGPAIVAASGGLAGAAVATLGPGPRGLAAALLLVALVPVVAIDLESRLIPDLVVLPAAAVGGALAALAEPARWWSPPAWALAASGFLALLWVVHPRGMGLGDVKLALAMGAVLGASVVPALAIAFAAGAALALAALARLGRRARGATIPFGPFLALGSACALWGGPALLAWYSAALG